MDKKTEARIRQLQARWFQVRACLETQDFPDHEFMQGSAFARVLDSAIRDILRRKVQQRAGVLSEWSELHSCIRITNYLMKQMRDEEAEQLGGWTLWTPKNEVQRAYSFLYDLLVDLGEGAVDIEGQHPDMDYYFEHIRSELPPMAQSL